MKKYYIYTLLAVITMTLSSCDDWFDVQPKSQVKADGLFESEGGFKRALIGVYTLMADDQVYGANGTMAFMEVLGGTYTSVRNPNNNFYNISKYDYENVYAVDVINNLWSANYNVIVNINNILDNIDDKKDLFTEGIYELIKGEALGLRAYIHFDLLRNFAPSPFNGLEANAIPYIDAVSVSPFPQLTLEQVLERIIVDLKTAEELLKDYDPIGPSFESYEENTKGFTNIDESSNASNFLLFRKERMNYYAVLGTLARVYLYRGGDEDMTNAYTYATNVLNSGKIVLNESTVIDNASNNAVAMTLMAQEYIFSLYKRNLSEVVNERYFYFNDWMNRNELSIDEIRRNEYYETAKYGGATDVRFNKLFGINYDGISLYLTKYDYQSYNVKRVPLLKVSEMYLIIAEAAKSMEQLMILRRKRGLKNIAPGTTLTEEIASEYRKELIGEGQLFYYYKRVNQLVNENMSGYDKFVLPIPDDEKERGQIN